MTFTGSLTLNQNFVPGIYPICTTSNAASDMPSLPRPPATLWQPQTIVPYRRLVPSSAPLPREQNPTWSRSAAEPSLWRPSLCSHSQVTARFLPPLPQSLVAHPRDPPLFQNHSNSDVVSINCHVRLAPNQEINFHLLGNLWLRSLKAVSGARGLGWRGEGKKRRWVLGVSHGERPASDKASDYTAQVQADENHCPRNRAEAVPQSFHLPRGGSQPPGEPWEPCRPGLEPGQLGKGYPFP